MAHSLSQQHFRTYDDVARWSTHWFASKQAKFYTDGIQTYLTLVTDTHPCYREQAHRQDSWWGPCITTYYYHVYYYYNSLRHNHSHRPDTFVVDLQPLSFDHRDTQS
ncbi:hypothetical protein AVEN_184373-1 [Araneus ventricosus]|uniref:Uncharacterized protein n=1 Tax=Araneus ventricosus TaxID=182803 RepID=A0A4Y2BFC8_ARAVE|nr:hypothetical protein AVEN_184373-1 [Araneus ventricosus]